MTGIAPPSFTLPPSSAVMGISLIDTTTRVTVPWSMFLEDEIPGFPSLEGAAFSFFLEHPSGDKLVFDLGWRPDYENMPPHVINPFIELREQGLADFSIEKDVATILQEEGIGLDEITAVILSHTHPDHIGDPSTFPNTTKLVVGPGFNDAFVPGYPNNPEGLILESDYEGRELEEITFTDDSLKLGRFLAVDYFGDGSFYLLNAPGHAIGHLNALVRTTPDTFVFLGGDSCHHGSVMRPTPYLPLPKKLRPSPFSHPPFRPGTHFLGQKIVDKIHPYHAWDQPFLHQWAPGSDRNVTDLAETVEKITEFDARDDIFIMLAHDTPLLDVVKTFPKKVNDWKKKGYKEKSRWRFLADLKPALDAAECSD